LLKKSYGYSTEPKENAGKSMQVIKYEYTEKQGEILHNQSQLKLSPPSGDSGASRPGFRENSWPVRVYIFTHTHFEILKYWEKFQLVLERQKKF